MATRQKTPKHGRRTRRWSAKVMQTSDALDLEPGVFKGDARAVARSLERSAEHSRRKKGTVLSSAMSMLSFYLNRGGKNLSPARRKVLENAKDELRRIAAPATHSGPRRDTTPVSKVRPAR